MTLIDVPPGLGHLTDMAMAAADRVAIVLMPEYDYLQGAIRMIHYAATRNTRTTATITTSTKRSTRRTDFILVFIPVRSEVNSTTAGA